MIFNIYISKANDCEYSTADGTFDLRAFGHKNRPKYTNIADTGKSYLKYSFNGCFPYSTKDTCKNAAVCVSKYCFIY